MPLGRYSVEVNGIADSFAEIIRNHYEEAAYKLANEKGQKLFAMTSEEYGKALKFLSQTPSQHDKALNKLSDDDAATILMRARYLGLVSARAINLADVFQFIPGKGYRQAASYAAEALLSARLNPSLSDVLPGWEPGAEPSGYRW